MTFIQSSISFAGYTFPAGFRMLDSENDTVIDEIKVPFLEGTSAPPGSRNSKIIRVQGSIGGWGAVDSAGANLQTPDQTENEFQLLLSAVESGYGQLAVTLTPARYIMAQKRKMQRTWTEFGGRQLIDVALEFLAQDPRWLSVASNTLATTSSPQNATNAGTAIAYPKWTFTASSGGTNPTLKITPAGGSGYVQVALTVTFLNGDVIVIDCDPRNRQNAVLLNGVPRLDLLGTAGITNTIGDSAFFPYMKPGVNVVTGSTATGTGTRSLSWQDAWL